MKNSPYAWVIGHAPSETFITYNQDTANAHRIQGDLVTPLFQQQYLTTEDALKIARSAADRHGRDHLYIREAGTDFCPHHWVLEAIREAYVQALGGSYDK